MDPALTQLADVRAARVRLDERELELIERARHQGATWAQIAARLGLGSRQAAEQRHQRLTAARRLRLEDRDRAFSSRIAELRRTLTSLQRWIDADRRWDSRFRRAGLVRTTADVALDAAPGSLCSLAGHIAADLASAERGRLPAPVQALAAELVLRLSMVR